MVKCETVILSGASSRMEGAGIGHTIGCHELVPVFARGYDGNDP
jgi:hypothetical protein